MKKTSFFGLGFALIISFLLCSCSDNTYLTSSSGSSALPGVLAVFDSSNTVNLAAGASQDVTVNFVTTTANATVSNLQITSSLPSGWTQTSFNCTTVTNNANDCVLVLHYAPTTVQSGTFSISYTYGSSQSGNSNLISYSSSVYAYVAFSDSGRTNGQIDHCLIADDGTFSNCAAAVSPLNAPITSMVVHGAYAYLTTTNGSLYYCSLGATGTLTCHLSGFFFANQPVGINFYGSMAYVAENNNSSAVTQITYASVAASGDLTSGGTTGTNAANPSMIDFSTAVLQKGYITNLDDSTHYTLCTFFNGFLTDCATQAYPGGLTPARIRINGTNAYLATSNGSNSLYICPINAGDGTLGSCVTTGSGFNAASDLTFRSSLAYVVNYISGGSASVCTVSSTDGSLTGCTTALSGIDYPTAVAFNG